MQGSQTLGKTKKKNAQRHSAGNIDYDNLQGSQEADDVPMQAQPGFRFRSKTVGDVAGKSFRALCSFFRVLKCRFFLVHTDPPPPPKRHGELERDPGTKSEGEDDSQHGTIVPCKKSLGKTPNHLTLR